MLFYSTCNERKHIIQFLLENQGFVSVINICEKLKQPQSIIELEIRKLEQEFPKLLFIKPNYTIEETVSIKIADYQDELAGSLLL